MYVKTGNVRQDEEDRQNFLLSYRMIHSNFSGSHQDTKTQRIDMAFTPLSEKEERT